jgi:hypothetical protein
MVYFMAIWSILRPFGLFCGNLVCFFPFLVFYAKKNLATLCRCQCSIELGPVSLQCQHTKVLARERALLLGCQIFIDTIYQKRGNEYQISTKLPIVHKIYKMAIKCSK